MEIFKFMENNPWLTFFLSVLIYYTIVESFKYISIMFRGYDPNPESEENEDVDRS